MTNKSIKKAIVKLKERSAFTVVSMLFIFLISIIVLLFILEVVGMFAIVKNAKASLERATLSAATVNEYRLYKNLREDLITPEPLNKFAAAPEVESVLVSEFGMDKKDDGLYKIKSDSEYYYRITDISVAAAVESGINTNRYRIDTTAQLHIPFNIMGHRELTFNIKVYCIYASKMNAVN